MSDITAIIVEDETSAAKNMRYLLEENAAEVRVIAVLKSIEETILWLRSNQPPMLGFFDIQLEDGLSFSIFKQVEIEFPVIFTTAFNEYAIEAFKVNSIDYLLKPVKAGDLKFALNKFKKLGRKAFDYTAMTKIMESLSINQTYSTLLISYRDKIIPVPVNDFAFFYIRNNVVYGCTHKKEVYPLDLTFEELEGKVRPGQFYRANRQYIVNRSAIDEISHFFNGRLQLQLVPPAPDTVLVSKAKVPLFKKWMQG